MSSWPLEMGTTAPADDGRAADRLAFYVVTLVVVPLAAATTVAVLAVGLPGGGAILGTGIVAGTVASSFAVWRAESWDVVTGVAVTATVCGAFLAFGLGATMAFWLFMLDPCSGPCV